MRKVNWQFVIPWLVIAVGYSLVAWLVIQHQGCRGGHVSDNESQKERKAESQKAGKPEPEFVLGVDIKKKSTDPLGIVRVSLGGGPEIGGYYCVYRGTKEEAILCLAAAHKAMKMMSEHLGPGNEPKVEPDDGKQYA